MLRFGVGGGGGGEEDVEKVGRTSGKILTTHLLKPETEQQESWRNVLSYHLSWVVLSRKRWSRITHDEYVDGCPQANVACRLFKGHESRYFVCLWSTHSLILANIICDNVSAVLVFLVRYMHKLSISSLSSYLRHDISDLRPPKRSPIRDFKSHILSMMLQSETWSSSSPGVPSRSKRFGDSWYCEQDELEERVTRWFRLDICLLMIIWSKCVYIAASVPFRLKGSERVFFSRLSAIMLSPVSFPAF